jgi:hypothetical protein
MKAAESHDAISRAISAAVEKARSAGAYVGEPAPAKKPVSKVEPCPRCDRELRRHHGWFMCPFCGPVKRETGALR